MNILPFPDRRRNWRAAQYTVTTEGHVLRRSNPIGKRDTQYRPVDDATAEKVRRGLELEAVA